MSEQPICPVQPPDYAPLMRDLVADGWSITSTINPRTPHLVAAVLRCPSSFLRMKIEQNTETGTARSTIATVTGGTSEPARWYASAEAPPARLWRDAARAAFHAQANRHEPPPFHPGATLKALGWSYAHSCQDGRIVERYADADGTRLLAHHHPLPAAPGMWTITRPGTSIGIAAIAAEPYALPALILTLVLSEDA
ncbi:hypothetical protein [Actinospica robiniae]|uniref:hypothetical protein n=1 Tax=Actinospica robiniae TaxID=304901 RepID=UPI0012FA66B1|nr:hypothetical protein [Actinospica robiniae]